MIGYNAQRCSNASVLAQSQPVNTDLNLAADDRRTERSNHAGVIVLNIEKHNRLFFVFWKLHSKSTWLKNLRGHVPLTLNGHDASACRSSFVLKMICI